jgi:hypothetical protein
MTYKRFPFPSGHPISMFVALVILALAAVATPLAQAQTFTALHAFKGGTDAAFRAMEG